MLSEFFTASAWKRLVVSVRGPGHEKGGLPNQDFAYAGCVGKYLLAMVCDGLGSHAHSDFGARTLCELFPRCFAEWSKYRPGDFDDLLRLLQARWLVRTRAAIPGKCGCTCQLAILNRKGKGWLAQLGDGMVLARHGEKVDKFVETKAGYANETMAMGDGDLQRYWRKSKIDLSRPGDRLLIMTDGISEDIKPQAENGFVSSFDLFFGMTASKGKHALEDALINWPTPHHLDDKTVVAVERR